MGCLGGEGLAPPQSERLPQQGRRGLVIIGGAGLLKQPVEPVQIHRHRVDRQDVAGGSPSDIDVVGAGQGFAQSSQIGVERTAGALRSTLSPGPVHQLVDRHGAFGVDEQHGQHAPLPGVACIDEPVVYAGLDSKDPTGTALVFSPAEWRAFVDGAKSGEFVC
jgi:hypothetical protein